MKPYIGIVHKDEGSAYGITFPDAPGCFSGADEIDDLFAMAREALELWAEGEIEDGRFIQEPRALSAIVSDPDWIETLENAKLFIAFDLTNSIATARNMYTYAHTYIETSYVIHCNRFREKKRWQVRYQVEIQ